MVRRIGSESRQPMEPTKKHVPESLKQIKNKTKKVVEELTLTSFSAKKHHYSKGLKENKKIGHVARASASKISY